MELLKKLTTAYGMPGWEAPVRAVILDELHGCTDSLEVDRMGNVLVTKDGTGAPLVLATHIDEPGMMVKQVDNNGHIRFGVWGLESSTLPGRPVLVGENRIPGIICDGSSHSQSPASHSRFTDPAQLYIDIGASSREETLSLIRLGEYIGFDMPFTVLDNGLINARALEARVGCAVLLKVFREYAGSRPLTTVFCTQRETGARGSRLAAGKVFGSEVIRVYGLGCAPDSETARQRSMSQLGRGPVLVHDAVCSSAGAQKLKDLADQKNIPLQVVAFDKDYSDGINFQTAQGGSPVMNMGIPIRHISTTAAMLDIADYAHTTELLKRYIACEPRQEV